jgi:hypothetical protein
MGYETMPLGYRFLMFRRHRVALQRQELITKWRDIVSEMKELAVKAAKSYKALLINSNTTGRAKSSQMISLSSNVMLTVS